MTFNTDPVISFKIGPYNLDKNGAQVIDKDTGYWMLDTGLTTYFVIPAVAKRRAGIQQKLRYYWIPAFAGMTGW